MNKYRAITPKTMKSIQLKYGITVALPKLIVQCRGNQYLDRYPYISVANKYLRIRNGHDRSSKYGGADYIDAVVRFLNYLYEVQGIDFDDTPDQLTFDLAQRYLNYYCTSLGRDGRPRSNNARYTERRYISAFLLGVQRSGCAPDLVKPENYIVKPEEKRRRKHGSTR